MYKIPFLHLPSFSRQGKYKETRVPSLPPADAEHESRTCHVHMQTNLSNSSVGCSWWEGRGRELKNPTVHPSFVFPTGLFFSLSQGYSLNRWTQWVRFEKEISMWVPYALCIFFPVKSVIPISFSSLYCATHDSLRSIYVCILYPYHPYKDLWSPSWYHCLQI